MARRQKKSIAEDLIDLVARLPWWAGVLLAFIFYTVLHQNASQPVAIARPAQTIWNGLATAVQYLLPLVCLAGAGMSACRPGAAASPQRSSGTS